MRVRKVLGLIGGYGPTPSLSAAHPSVVDVAVFGVPDEEYGERVHATVQLVPGIDLDDGQRIELESFLRSRFAGYKVPKD